MLTKKDSLNTGEAAQLLTVHVETIRRLSRSGGIPAFRAGSEHYQDQRRSIPAVNDHLTIETKK